MLFKLGIALTVVSAICMFYILNKNGGKLYSENDEKSDEISSQDPIHETDSKRVHISNPDDMHLAVVACGDRLNETLTMIKSALLLSRKHIQVHIFAELDLHLDFKERIDDWPSSIQSKFHYHLYDITFPEGKENEWKKLFKPCASQRLFLPHILKDVDSLLYVDTDILFLRPMDDVWEFFSQFNSSHISALSPEHEDPAAGWYNRFARHPYYGPLGVNSGVMLMNLTRIRNNIPWLNLVEHFYNDYKLKITWGDQDIINIIFHYHPDKLFIFSCDWNYRPDHCMYMSVCKAAEDNGISVVHGNRGVYHNEKQPAFRAIYEAFRDYDFGGDLKTGLIANMKDNLKKAPDSNCGTINDAFSKQLEYQVNKLYKQDKER